MNAVKKLTGWLIPGVKHAEDGREVWPSRLSFILASMGLAVGIGNLLRYPSIVYRNWGAQWFIPYFMALIFVGIPLLILEISIGQAYRGGAVVGFNRVNPRLRGLGLAVVYVGYTIATYYVVILAWAMVFFRHSFTSPLPWKGNATVIKDFFDNEVVKNGATNKEVIPWTYPEVSVIGETLGWTMFLWILVYLSIFKGVSLTGRIVYFSMLFPLAMLIVILVRAVTLENAWDGIRLYIGTWNGSKLGSGNIWRDAVGQIFFSIGTGFGSFIAYASYNNKYANAVQDAFIIALSNSFYEVVAGFAAFGVVGFLQLNPDKEKKLGTFVIAFRTYPQAIAQLPGANVWSVLFFVTIVLLGIDSAFGLLEGAVTVVTDTSWGKRLPRWLVIGIMAFTAALFSIMYTTEFGLSLLDAVDGWFNNAALILSMWVQCVGVLSMYRYKDVISQTGFVGFVIANVTYISSMILLVLLGHLVNVWVGVIVFVIGLIGGTVLAVLLSTTPQTPGPFARNSFIDRLWWLTSYSGHQLSKDLNAVVARGKNWSIPFFWAPMLRWLTAPVLMIILSFTYADADGKFDDPLQIFAFIVAHVVAVVIIIGLIVPRIFSVFISPEKKKDHLLQYAKEPRETVDDDSEIPTIDPNETEVTEVATEAED